MPSVATVAISGIAGLGPHGERAAEASQIELTEADIAAARAAGFSVGVVLHTLEGDWSKQQVAGIVGTLGDCGAAVIEVADSRFAVDGQVEALMRLTGERPDAIISLPVANAAVAEAHRQVADAGISLFLLDNVPTGLAPGRDYETLVSADNFGLGQIGAQLLSSHLPYGASVGVLTYDVDFFVTNEREIAFCKWMRAQRQDITLHVVKFPSIEGARQTAEDLLGSQPSLSGLFAVWEAPALRALAALKSRGLELPVTTIDLGNEVAMEMAGGGMIKGIGAQQPYAQGVAAAKAAIGSLLGRPTPEWVALPGLPVTRDNVVESFQAVWRAPAPRELVIRSRE